MILTVTGEGPPVSHLLLSRQRPVAPILGQPERVVGISPVRLAAIGKSRLHWVYCCTLLLCWGFITGLAQAAVGKEQTGAILEQFGHAAKQGDVVAQTNLGTAYLNGVGVHRDLTKAFYWFQQAAKQGDGLAQFNLGSLYLEGGGTTKDSNQAIHWLQQVDRQSSHWDQFNPVVKGWTQLKLGFIYYEGRGVQQDYQEALTWFTKAAERGLVMAQEMLGHMYAKGLGSQPDTQRARHWYERAARQGSQTSAQVLQQTKQPTATATASQQTQSPMNANTVATPNQAAPLVGNPPGRSSSTVSVVPMNTPAPQIVGEPGLEHRSSQRGLRPHTPTEDRDNPRPPAIVLNDHNGEQGRKAEHFALTVVPVPLDARVRIRNIRPKYQPGMLLAPGKYRLEVSREGYQTADRWVTIPDGNTELNIALLPEKPTVAVANTQKRTTSLVQPQTKTATTPSPMDAPSVPAVKTVKAAKSREMQPATPSQLVETSKSMEACPLATRYNLPMPRRHVLTVQSMPEQAHVRILNIKTPYRQGMSLPPGRYHLAVSKEAFETRQCWAEISDRDLDLDVALAAIAPDNLYALTIKPQPADARIRLLNIQTPYRPGVLLPPGAYQVEVAKNGYKTERVSLQLDQKKQEVPVVLTELTLEDKPTLTVVPVLKKAQIRILNANLSYRPELPLTPGKYLVEVAKPGFKTHRRWVELTEKNLRVDIELEDGDANGVSTLMIQPTPADAKVRILNIKAPYQPGMRLEPAPYHIEVSQTGYHTKQQWLTLPVGENQFPVVLEPIDPAERSLLP